MVLRFLFQFHLIFQINNSSKDKFVLNIRLLEIVMVLLLKHPGIDYYTVIFKQ